MRKKIMLLALGIFIILGGIFIFGNKSNKEINPNDAIDYLKNLNSYSCDVSVHIKNSKQEIEKNCKQFYNKKFGHRLDIGDKRILLYKENDITVRDLNNNKQYKIDKNFDDVYKLSFIEEYIGLLYTNQDIESSFKTIKDREYQLINLTIPGNNRNINKAILYVNLENNNPEKIAIYDIKGKEMLSFLYKNFIPNAEIAEEVFKK
ncbi:germination lipoprotein GerS-related protein [Clostridium botulinum]|uniref:Membrane protein n=1 Tax=Clostridium botulinum TaxID=1491 RepID=A0A9Q1ZBR3_CLOBO|nr:germination lipoprotein GerS-related protein [Clostridium botulinum]KEH98892.1 membrane protein [Clostridium botulinum D str. 16868]KEI05650.1 membrane protein [Clostridium botulinum C/D str. Sp77]KLU75017.1 membrane protein [Clostridium botulinum V891]KOA74362.1 membrane protein [Clostridium botulinum]KOA77805.1 membrane protein [Clostridium botulinum]